MHRLARMEVETAVFMRSYSRAPNSWDTATEQPRFRPVATAINSMVTGYDTPIAAGAAPPTHWPAIMLSAI